jgi:hypothetical protein
MATFWTDVSYGQKAVETFMANYTTNESWLYLSFCSSINV